MQILARSCELKLERTPAMEDKNAATGDVDNELVPAPV